MKKGGGRKDKREGGKKKRKKEGSGKKKFIHAETQTRSQWISRPAHTRLSNLTTCITVLLYQNLHFANGIDET